MSCLTKPKLENITLMSYCSFENNSVQISMIGPFAHGLWVCPFLVIWDQIIVNLLGVYMDLDAQVWFCFTLLKPLNVVNAKYGEVLLLLVDAAFWLKGQMIVH